MMIQYAPMWLNLLFQGSEERGIPCAFIPALKRRYVTAMQSHVMIPLSAVSCTRNEKMLAELEPAARNASKLKHQVVSTATQGLPHVVVFWNILGAVPLPAIEWRVRTDVKRSPIPADNLEIMMQEFMIDGRILMPAAWMAITYGLADALDEDPSRGWLEGIMMLTMNAPRK
jgi:hypothetical protein